MSDTLSIAAGPFPAAAFMGRRCRRGNLVPPLGSFGEAAPKPMQSRWATQPSPERKESCRGLIFVWRC